MVFKFNWLMITLGRIKCTLQTHPHSQSLHFHTHRRKDVAHLQNKTKSKQNFVPYVVDEHEHEHEHEHIALEIWKSEKVLPQNNNMQKSCVSTPIMVI